MRNVSDKICRDNQNTHPAVCEIMPKNTVEPGRPQMTIWRMRTAGWIPKAKNTHSEYIILITFPLKQLLHERS